MPAAPVRSFGQSGQGQDNPFQEKSWRHGISLFGDLKYPAQFAHFDYVNPGAPKEGTVRQGEFGTYDNFNLVVAGLKGNLAAGINLIYETLLTPSLELSRIWADRRGHQLSTRLFLRDFSLAVGSSMARRQAS